MGNQSIYDKYEQMTRDYDLLKQNLKHHEKTIKLLQLVIDSMPQRIFWKDQNGVYSGCNEKFAQEAGFESKDDIVGKTDIDLARNKGDTNFYMSGDRKTMDITTPKYNIIDSQIRADGKEIWLDINKIPMRDPDGNISGIITTYEEVTGRKEAESGLQHYREELEQLVAERTLRIENSKNELKEQYDFLQKLIDTIPNPVFYGSRDGLCIGCNSAIEEFLGKDKSKIIGKSVFEILPEGEAKKYHKYQVEMFSNSGFQQTEDEILHKDGSRHYIRCNRATFTDTNGKVAGFIGVVSDITDLKKAQENLLKLGIENETLIRSISSFLIGVDSNGLITTWNKVAQNLFGIDSEKVKRLPFAECGCLWEWERIKDGISKCLESHSPVSVDNVLFTKTDGKSGFLGITLNPMVLEEADNTGFLLMGADITDRKHMELQLAQSSKLESIGQLSAGIAHEINTPIHYIGDNILFLQNAHNDIEKLIGYFRQLIDAVKQGDRTDNIVDDAEKAMKKMDLNYLAEEIPLAIQQTQDGIARVAKIVRSIKDFSHPDEEEKSNVDINHSLENIITVTRNEWKYTAEMETDFDEFLPLVFAYAGELNQVFLNIIVNAAHAVSDVVNKHPEQKGIISLSTCTKDDFVEIRIGDTGTGIPKDIRSRIFDPFFTTKEVGKGTGQGLAISHSIIVQKHCGSLSFETEEGAGTTFIIRLPLKNTSETLGA
ncbi:MAG: PAS domain S-box protein [Desulfobacterales bacterium]